LYLLFISWARIFGRGSGYADVRNFGIFYCKDPDTGVNSGGCNLPNGVIFLQMNCGGVSVNGCPSVVYYYTAETPLALNTWYHIAATRSADVLTLFINGVQASTYTNPLSFVWSNDESPLSIGYGLFYVNNQLQGHHSPFDGMIDEVRIWDYPRTAAQITATMNTELRLSGNYPGYPIFYFRLNEESGTIAYDAGIYKINGIIGATSGNTANMLNSAAPTISVPSTGYLNEYNNGLNPFTNINVNCGTSNMVIRQSDTVAPLKCTVPVTVSKLMILL